MAILLLEGIEAMISGHFDALEIKINCLLCFLGKKIRKTTLKKENGMPTCTVLDYTEPQIYSINLPKPRNNRRLCNNLQPTRNTTDTTAQQTLEHTLFFRHTLQSFTHGAQFLKIIYCF